MWPEANLRYRTYRTVTAALDHVARKLLAVRSQSYIDNIKAKRADLLLKSTAFDRNGRHFEIYHRGTRADLGVLKQIFLDEDYDIERFKQAAWIAAAYADILSKGMVPATIDAGANIGFGSIYFKQKFAESQIIAVEPATSNLKVLRRNIGNSGARIVHGAIHTGAATIKLFDPDEGEWGFSTHDAQAGGAKAIEEVRCYRFSDLIAAGEIPFILKVDIEGAEKDEFNDFEFLSQFALIIIELHDWLYPGERTSSSLLKFAAAADFDFCHRGENVFLFNRQFRQLS